MADDHQQDADENARNQAALAAYDRQRPSLRDRHAAFQERQQNSPGIAGQVSPQGRGGGWRQPSCRFGAPPAAPQLDDAAGDFAPPQPPQFAMDTAAALTAASQAMQAIAATIGDQLCNLLVIYAGKSFIKNYEAASCGAVCSVTAAFSRATLLDHAVLVQPVQLRWR